MTQVFALVVPVGSKQHQPELGSCLRSGVIRDQRGLTGLNQLPGHRGRFADDFELFATSTRHDNSSNSAFQKCSQGFGERFFASEVRLHLKVMPDLRQDRGRADVVPACFRGQKTQGRKRLLFHELGTRQSGFSAQRHRNPGLAFQRQPRAI